MIVFIYIQMMSMNKNNKNIDQSEEEDDIELDLYENQVYFRDNPKEDFDKINIYDCYFDDKGNIDPDLNRYGKLKPQAAKRFKQLKEKQLEESRRALTDRAEAGNAGRYVTHEERIRAKMFGNNKYKNADDFKSKFLTKAKLELWEKIRQEDKERSIKEKNKVVIEKPKLKIGNIIVELDEDIIRTAHYQSEILQNKYENKNNLNKKKQTIKSIVYEYLYDLTMFVKFLMNAYYIDDDFKTEIYKDLSFNEDISVKLAEFSKKIEGLLYLYDDFNSLIKYGINAFNDAKNIINLTKNNVKLGSYKSLIGKYIKLLSSYLNEFKDNKNLISEKIEVLSNSLIALDFEKQQLLEEALNIFYGEDEIKILKHIAVN